MGRYALCIGKLLFAPKQESYKILGDIWLRIEDRNIHENHEKFVIIPRYTSKVCK